MNRNPNYSARFHIKPPRSAKSDTPTPLLIRVWISAEKRNIYLSTGNKVTPAQWRFFQSDGTPLSGADPKVIAVVDGLRAAVQYVVSGTIVNGEIATFTSQMLKARVESVIARMEANAKSGVGQPICSFSYTLREEDAPAN